MPRPWFFQGRGVWLHADPRRINANLAALGGRSRRRSGGAHKTMGVSMRLFNLFLRRAGMRSVPVRVPSSTSRLTVVCPRHQLADVRKQIYLGFEGSGLRVATLLVDDALQHDMARTCVTVHCPPELRSVLMTQARQLSQFPGVAQVQWGDQRHIALN